jgi:hypothetical protein
MTANDTLARPASAEAASRRQAKRFSAQARIGFICEKRLWLSKFVSRLALYHIRFRARLSKLGTRVSSIEHRASIQASSPMNELRALNAQQVNQSTTYDS